MQIEHKTVVAVWTMGALLLLPLTGAHAKIVSFTGTMKTQADFGRTYIVDVGEPLKTLTLSIPVPQSGSIFGYEEKASQAAVDSSIPPTSERDITDSYGNNLHVLEYDNFPPGTLTVHVNIIGVTLTSDLDVPLPPASFPVNVDSDDAAACLRPTENSQSDSEAIRTLSQTITAGATDEASAALAISKWMIENIAYDTDGPSSVRTPP